MVSVASDRTELVSSGDATTVAMLLASGGDDRLAIDPATGRNRYGVPLSPANDEIWFSSSTAAAISDRGFLAAQQAYRRLFSTIRGDRTQPDRWFDDIRARILGLVDSPGAEAILCASGTETEILALTLARGLLQRPLTNIVMAQQETGAGVMHAAAGTHFNQSAALRTIVEKGKPLEGWHRDAIEAEKVDIRDADGHLRDNDDVDGELTAVIEQALRRGRDVVLHVLDTSKVGQGGPSRQTARRLSRQHAGRILTVVDACQLRCSFEAIGADLAAGFMVMITGSKFAGGPPFCGTLLIPKEMVDKLGSLQVPAGLAAYSAQQDWPRSLRSALHGDNFVLSNIGLGLRWEAALAEMEAYQTIGLERRRAIVEAFGDRVCAMVAKRPHMSFLDGDPRRRSEHAATIFPIVVGSGHPTQALRVYKAMSEPLADVAEGDDAQTLLRRCHAGQPVVIEGRSALRICIGMVTINSAASRLDRMSSGDAMAPIFSDLETMFRKWDLLERERL